jgi:hypothetical protein
VEGRLVVLRQTGECVRKYGSHLSSQDLEKIQMPKIWWNALISSVRDLRNLEKIVLINYKQVFESKQKALKDNQSKATGAQNQQTSSSGNAGEA